MSAPGNDDAPTVASGQGVQVNTAYGADFDASGLARGAELVLTGERMAHDYLKALTSGIVSPGQLPACIAVLAVGPANTLHGFARVIEKALAKASTTAP